MVSAVAAITLDLIGIDQETSNILCQRITKEHGLERSHIAIVLLAHPLWTSHRQ